jgi:hypothetical protein
MRKEGEYLQDLGFSSYSPFPFHSLLFRPSFLFCPGIGKEVRRERWMGHKDIGVRKGGQAAGPSQMQ